MGSNQICIAPGIKLGIGLAHVVIGARDRDDRGLAIRGELDADKLLERLDREALLRGGELSKH